MEKFNKVVLYTDTDGRAKFRDEYIDLFDSTPNVMLSKLDSSSGYQIRLSPVGFQSNFHCTPVCQFVFILSGVMEIGLQDGTSRKFGPGEHFYSSDKLPDGVLFDPNIHGHWSCQHGSDPLITLFLRSD